MKERITKNIFAENSIASVGILLLFCVYPFIMRNGYHDITSTRYLFFCGVSLAIFAICVVFAIVGRHSVNIKPLDFLISLEPMDAAFLFFILCACLSTAFSRYASAALYGDAGRYMGLLAYLACGLTYIWISRFFIPNGKEMTIFCMIASVTAIFAFLQFEGVDLFGLLSSVSFEKRKNFLSPFGNINVFSSYLSMAIPFIMYMFCFSEEKKEKILFGVFTFAVFIGFFTSNSDSGYVYCCAAFFLLFLAVCDAPEKLKDFFLLAALAFSAASVFGFIFRTVNGTRGLSSISETVVNSPLALSIALLCFVLFFITAKKPFSPVLMRRIRRAVIIAAVGIAALVFMAFLYFSFMDTYSDIGLAGRYLRFNDSWGTDRGFVWKRLLKIFAAAPLPRKLFGYGAETVSLLMAENFGAEMTDSLGYVFDDAHNEFLQYLLTMGVTGLAAYVLLFVAAVKRCIGKDVPTTKKALCLSVICYASQAVFSIIQPISTPFIFVFFALIRSESTADIHRS